MRQRASEGEPNGGTDRGGYVGFLRDSIAMDSGPIELRMEICEGEHRNHDGKGPLRTRLDFFECYPLPPGKRGEHRGVRYRETREWFATLREARARQRATVPAMLARYLQLIAKHGDYPADDCS